MSWSNEQDVDALAKVVEKAKTDVKVRELVLSDVYAAVKEVTGKEVSNEFKINVVDGTGYHINIVLPEVQGSSDGLTETELEEVAGGIVAPPMRAGESPEDYGSRLKYYRDIGIWY